MKQEIVEKFLNKMDTMQQNIYDKIDAVQQDIYDKMDAVQQDIYDKMDSKMDAMQQDIYDKMDSKMDAMQQDIYARMDSKLNVIQQDIRTLQKEVAIIQYEHGNKIQLLLDYAVQNSEEHAKMNALLEKHSSILDNHEIRLQVVEDKLASSL